MKTFACTFLASAFAALVLTPLVAHIARRLGLVDVPGPRKVHSRPVPRIGGVAIVLAVLGSTVLAMAVNNTIGDAFRTIQIRVVALLAAGFIVFIIGLIDDIRGLPALVKLVGLTGCALLVCFSGTLITSVTVSGWFTVDLGWLAWPVTVIWILVITVGLNFIDGLDGLASGISAIACGVIAVLAFQSHQPVMVVLMLAVLGGLAGFLVFNFNPARIFMGDCGSFFLGFLLAAGSVMCAAKTATFVGLALPALALGVPIFDAMFTMVRRGILERRSIFAAERGHIHHRLLDMGLKQRHVVLLIYAVTAMAAGLGMFMMVARDMGALVVFVCLLLLLLLVFRCVGSVRPRETLAAIRRNWSIHEEAKKEKQCLGVAQLRCREARTFDEWWKALCAAAGQLEFASLALSVEASAGGEDGVSVSETLIWRNPALTPSPEQDIHVTLPLRILAPGVHGRMELAVWVNGSLESAARRATLFSRLLDEHWLADPTRLFGALEGRPHGLAIAELIARGALHDRPPRDPMLWDAV